MASSTKHVAHPHLDYDYNFLDQLNLLQHNVHYTTPSEKRQYALNLNVNQQGNLYKNQRHTMYQFLAMKSVTKSDRTARNMPGVKNP